MIYLFVLIIIVFLAFFLNIKSNRRHRLFFVIVSFGLLGLIAALRKYTVGIDMNILYAPLFPKIASVDFSNLSIFPIEFGYVLFNKILSLFSSDVQILIVFSSIFVISIYGYFIYKNSSNVFISTLLFIMLNIYFMCMNIVRQQIAVSFILIAFCLWFNKKGKINIYSIILILVASSFHASSIIMIPILLLYGKKYNKNTIIIFLTVAIISLLFYKQFINLYANFSTMFNLSNNKDYTYYLESEKYGISIVNLNSISSLLLSLGILAISYYYLIYLSIDNITFEKKLKNSFYMYMVSFYTLFNILVLKMGILQRLQYYFLPFVLLIIPECLKYCKRRENSFIIVSLLFGFVTFKFIYILFKLADSLYGVVPYVFYWQ